MEVVRGKHKGEELDGVTSEGAAENPTNESIDPGRGREKQSPLDGAVGDKVEAVLFKHAWRSRHAGIDGNFDATTEGPNFKGLGRGVSAGSTLWGTLSLVFSAQLDPVRYRCRL